jgi:hypothetical protein
MYDGQTSVMLNIEFARVIQTDREREIEAELRIRRLLRPTESAEPIEPAPAAQRTLRPSQRPASNGAVAR